MVMDSVKLYLTIKRKVENWYIRSVAINYMSSYATGCLYARFIWLFNSLTYIRERCSPLRRGVSVEKAKGVGHVAEALFFPQCTAK